MNKRRRACFVQFARWRYRGEVCRLRLHLVCYAVAAKAEDTKEQAVQTEDRRAVERGDPPELSTRFLVYV